MVIKKLINNNMIIARGKDGGEIIVVGKGIGFQQKPGGIVPDNRVEKIYRMQDKKHSRRLQELMENTPMEYILLADKLVSYVNAHYSKKTNETLMIVLMDHVSSALQRYKKGIELNNPMLWDIKKIYKEEFEIGKQLLVLIERETGIKLREDEAGFIALNIVNSQLDQDVDTVIEITRIVQGILNIVRYHYLYDFDEDSVYYVRFLIHLKFLAIRILGKTKSTESFITDLLPLDELSEKYADVSIVVGKIEEFLKKNYGCLLNKDEKLYLSIHILTLLKSTGFLDREKK